jgi:osmotically-inducible protein OsmY
MPDHSAHAADGLAVRLERQLAETGLQVAVDQAADGTLVLSGLVQSEEERLAAGDIVAQAAPSARIDNQLDVETVLPTDIDDFAGAEPSAEMAERRSDVATELDADFTDQRLLRDPTDAAGPTDTDDPVESGDEVYTPPDDPVIAINRRGEAEVLSGFGEDADVPVERSTMDERPGDEALADAIRQQLREDAATADLDILVAVRHGVAHLRGRVADLDDAENAEAVAARVPGVREVVEELEVP